jgi:hypothetical protein
MGGAAYGTPLKTLIPSVSAPVTVPAVVLAVIAM